MKHAGVPLSFLVLSTLCAVAAEFKRGNAHQPSISLAYARVK